MLVSNKILCCFIFLVLHAVGYSVLIDNPEAPKKEEIYNIYKDIGELNVEIGVCKKEGEKLKSLYWMHNGLIVINGTSGFLLKTSLYNELAILVEKMTASKVGKYTCAELENRKVIKTVNVDIKDKPVISNRTNSTLMVPEGDNVDIWCDSESFTKKISTSWYLMDTDSNKIEIGITGKKLQIVNITRHCAAKYRCEAHNSKGTDSRDFVLKVQYKPIVSIKVENKSEQDRYIISGGGEFNMKCFVECDPPANGIEWSVNGNVIGYWNKTDQNTQPMYKKYAMVTKMKDSLNMKLEKKKGQKPQTFKCTATNNLGETSKIVSITFN